jgi:hypothetical protein
MIPNRGWLSAVFFADEAVAKEFVALARSGASSAELSTFVEQHVTTIDHLPDDPDFF